MYKIKAHPKDRPNIIFGSYDLKIVFSNENYGYLGRGSFGLLAKIKYLPNVSQDTPLFIIGNYCEAAPCSILIGGSHKNDEVYNLTFGGNLALRVITGVTDTTVHRTTRVGNGVLLSHDCVVVHGSTIGDSAVIGANEVVRATLPIPSYYYFSGGKNLRPRISEEEIAYLSKHQWWSASNDWLISHFSKILMMEDCEVPLEISSYRLLLRYTSDGDALPGHFQFFGIEKDGVHFDLDHLSAPLKAYFSQVGSKDESIVWTPNIFNLHSL